MEFKDYFVTFLIIGLFIFAVFSFSSYMSTENDAPVNINQEPIISKMVGNVSQQLNTSAAKAQTQQEAFNKESTSAVSTALGFVFSSILSALSIFRDMGVTIIFGFFVMVQEIFSTSPVIAAAIGVISAIIIGLIVLAAWSVVRAGR